MVLVFLSVGAIGVTAQDRPLRIHQKHELYYPLSTETQEYPTGTATILIHVDPRGQLLDAMIVRYSLETFGEAALNAVREWTFEPPLVNGEPRGVRQALNFKFEVDGMAVTRTPGGYHSERVSRMTGVYTHDLVAGGRELDKPLATVQSVVPRPVPISAETRVRLDFYVDAGGVPRMPVVVEADDLTAGASALEAIAEWRFEAPRRRGRPVLVRASQEFVFDPGDASGG